MTLLSTSSAHVHGPAAKPLAAAPDYGAPQTARLLHQFTVNGQTFGVVEEQGESNDLPADSLVATFTAGGQRLQLVELSQDTPLAEMRSPENQLTARELEIVQLVADGNSNKLISKHLQISEWTVGSHLRRIFLKLGVDTRAQMVHVCSARILGGNGLSA
ncbi:MAG: response regulator transcription factor [Cyanobacteriota bacterium]|jgi:DNA-binding CsgD family transcriptional regulator